LSTGPDNRDEIVLLPERGRRGHVSRAANYDRPSPRLGRSRLKILKPR
jgi:hypothetical protein